MIKEYNFSRLVVSDPSDTPASLAEKVHALEYLHYPKVIGEMVEKLPDFLIKGPEELKTTVLSFQTYLCFPLKPVPQEEHQLSKDQQVDPFI